MNKKIQAAKNSAAVAEKMNDKDIKVELAVDKMLVKPVSRKQTETK